jgi:hypothetical protein
MVLRSEAKFDIACRLRRNGISIGELFSFLSGLYFRGKMSYAKAFGTASSGIPAAFVITPNRGLLPIDTIMTLSDFKASARVNIDPENLAYIRPFARDARRLAKLLGTDGQVIFLGSISTNKYTDVLLRAFGQQLLFPTDFVGRGDMSRGGLLLRCVSAREELEYEPVLGAIRHGKRPPKLTALRLSA